MHGCMDSIGGCTAAQGRCAAVVVVLQEFPIIAGLDLVKGIGGDGRGDNGGGGEEKKMTKLATHMSRLCRCRLIDFI